MSDKLSLLEREQIRTEMDSVSEGVSRYRRIAEKAVGRGDVLSLAPVERIAAEWYVPLAQFVQETSIDIRNSGVGHTIWGPPITLLGSERAAVVAIYEVLRHCLLEPGGVKFQRVCYSIGRAVIAEITLDILRDLGKADTLDVDRVLAKDRTAAVNRYGKETLDDPIWNCTVACHTGSRLAYSVMMSCRWKGDRAFSVETRRSWNSSSTHLMMDEAVFGDIEYGHRIREVMRPRYQPMLVPPKPWSETQRGGYLRIRTGIIKRPCPEQLEAVCRSDMGRVREAVNRIGSIPWRLNTDIIDDQMKVWEDGGGYAGVPSINDEPMPPEIESGDEDAINANRRERALVFKRNAQRKADRSDFLILHGHAESFRGRDRIYIPHNLDFRGRAYAMPATLNPQRGDAARSMFEFSKPRRLTERGMWWLKVHAANCYGMDKVAYGDRVRWVDNHWREIERCAAEPHETDFWHYADDGDSPWQFLAACRALVDNKRGSRLPVQVDGSCNGLQHYSALGRDELGASWVNMLPADEPRDIYTRVADLVAEQVEKDADTDDGGDFFTTKAGETVRLQDVACTVHGHITRRVVKPPVMTSVYGVTFIGARQQVYDKLDRINLNDTERYRASMYLARIILASMDDVVPSAWRNMRWLTDVGRIVAKERRDLISWTSPIGMPVVQPYRKRKSKQIVTAVSTFWFGHDGEGWRPAVSNQTDAFAPNFIHSLDASHMMMVATDAIGRGLSFGAVHDSFWSHANDMDELQAIIRESFIALHKQDILQSLVDSWRLCYDGVDFPDPPPYGSFDVSIIRDAPYMFS